MNKETKEFAKFWLARCYDLASDSPDPSNQNGALVIDRRRQEALGAGRNEFPYKVQVTDELINDREKKLFYIEHAERNAIFSAAKYRGIQGCIMVCPWFACADCARAIVLSGITKVYGHKQRMDQTPERWKASVEAGLDLIRLHDVQIEFYDGEVGCKPIIVNGQSWQP